MTIRVLQRRRVPQKQDETRDFYPEAPEERRFPADDLGFARRFADALERAKNARMPKMRRRLDTPTKEKTLWNAHPRLR